jgi:hypothetical protein
MDASVACPVCATSADDLGTLAVHLVERAEASDGRHVMWLNRNATMQRTSAADLTVLLATAPNDDHPSSDRIKR